MELMSCIAKDSCIQLSIYLNYILSTYTDSSWHDIVTMSSSKCCSIVDSSIGNLNQEVGQGTTGTHLKADGT